MRPPAHTGLGTRLVEVGLGDEVLVVQLLRALQLAARQLLRAGGDPHLAVAFRTFARDRQRRALDVRLQLHDRLALHHAIAALDGDAVDDAGHRAAHLHDLVRLDHAVQRLRMGGPG